MSNKNIATLLRENQISGREMTVAFLSGKRFEYRYAGSNEFPKGTIADFTDKVPVLSQSGNGVLLSPSYSASFQYLFEIGTTRRSLESQIEAQEAIVEAAQAAIKADKLRLKIMDELDISVITPEIEKAYHIINVMTNTKDLRSSVDTISKIIIS